MTLFNYKLKKRLGIIKNRMRGFYDKKAIAPQILEIIDKYPNCSEAYYLYGISQESIKHLDQAIKLNKSYCDAYFSRSRIKKSQNSKREAYEDLLNVVKYLNKSTSITYLQLSRVYYDLASYEYSFGNKLKAIEYYNKAIEQHESYFFYLGRGKLYFEIKDYQNALNDINIAIDLEPNNKKTYILRAKIKSEMGDDTGYLEDVQLSLKEFYVFNDKVDGKIIKKVFEKNLQPAPKVFYSKNLANRICPNCNSNRIASYFYGLPDFHSFSKQDSADIENGNLILAGCTVYPNSPVFICRDCGAQFLGKTSISERNDIGQKPF